MKQYYVEIPNKMFAYETEFYVDEYELYVYYIVAKNVLAWDTKCTRTSIDLLYQLIGLYDTNESRAKKKIKESLLKLKDKGYLEFECPSSFKNSKLLTINLFENNSEIFTNKISTDHGNFHGYTKVDEELIKRANNLYQIKILTYIVWRKGIKYSISYAEWASVLGVSDATAKQMIARACEENLIIKNRGQYYVNAEGEPRQQMNSYSVKEQKNKTINSNKEEKVKLRDVGAKLACSEKRKHNWYDSNSKINEDDVYIYLTSESSTLKERAEKRMNAISQSSPDGNRMISEFIRKANQRIYKDKVAERQEEASVRRYIDEMSNDREFVFQKQVTNDDYSYLLGDE